MPLRFKPSVPSAAGLARAVRFAWIAGFVVLVARFWDPHYGFTALLQANEVTEARLPPELRDAPIFIHRGEGRYDGAYYAQIAIDPTLRHPALNEAVNSLGYRARRILLSATAWVAGGGDPVAAVRAYAWLNVLLWLVLAWLGWRIFPADGGWRATLAWVGVLSGGALLSVRLALTDLAALTLLAAAIPLVERGRTIAATGLLGLAGLARETALLGAGALLPAGVAGIRGGWRRLGLAGLAVLPLVGWLAYIRTAPGTVSPGADNFSLPFVGLIGRVRELVRLQEHESNHLLLGFSWLAHAALLVQMVYFVVRPQRDSAWWRVGVLHGLLAVVLGSAVWEGMPGAAGRILLPMTLAFNVLAVRQRASWAWLASGNLMVALGVWSLFSPPLDPRMLNSRAGQDHSLVLETDARWSAVEWNDQWRWAWCGRDGGLVVRRWPHKPEVRMELRLRGVTPRAVEVLHNGKVVWRGPIGDRPGWIVLPVLPARNGRLELEVRSDAPPLTEGEGPTRRSISIACFDVREIE